jgi:L-lactate dehydrogenase (cytochrome)
MGIGCNSKSNLAREARPKQWRERLAKQLAEIVDAVGDRIDVICDGGITRGTHVLKALSVGAKACSGGRLYLYALAAAGQAGVERALENLRAEIERDMKLMGCRSVDQLNRDNLRFR